jgi:regulator of replication initiation timing
VRFSELQNQVAAMSANLSEESQQLLGLIMLFCEGVCKENEELRKENEELRNRMKLLKDQLAQNSSNSSRPPSQDGYKSGEKRSMRTPSGKSPGGQRGHKGTGGVLKENPDETILYKLETCPSCHRSVIDIPLDELVRKQVEDIPPLRTIVTEHQMEVKTCPDCQIQWMAGGCPPEVVHTFQYGPRIRAFSLYLSAYQFLPIKRTVQALALFGVALSCGTLDNFRKAAALDLVVFMATLKASVRKAIGCDPAVM